MVPNALFALPRVFVLHSSATSAASGVINVPCTRDEDCSLNGVCTSGGCFCDPGWTTLPFGVGGAMEPGCGYLDLGRAEVTACGPACAFHGGDRGVDLATTSGVGPSARTPRMGRT